MGLLPSAGSGAGGPSVAEVCAGLMVWGSVGKPLVSASNSSHESGLCYIADGVLHAHRNPLAFEAVADEVGIANLLG